MTHWPLIVVKGIKPWQAEDQESIMILAKTACGVLHFIVFLTFFIVVQVQLPPFSPSTPPTPATLNIFSK